jgi:hypothetical protein
MVKITFREDDDFLDQNEYLWDPEDSVFDSKSHFYRFTRDYTLNELTGAYSPRLDDFEERKKDMQQLEEGAAALVDMQEKLNPGYDLAVAVRTILTNEDLDESEKVEEATTVVNDYLEKVAPNSLYTNHVL